jgi:hypothetical protein
LSPWTGPQDPSARSVGLATGRFALCLPLPGATSQILSFTPSATVFCGKSCARPESVIRRWPTMSLFARLPVKKRYISANDSREVATCTWVWFGIVTLVAPTICRPGTPRPAQSASVGTPPGGASAVRPSMFT